MSHLRTWLQLLRAPNLFTVPGDPLAGYLLASFASTDARIFLAIGASFCFYAGGLLLNDVADLEEDRAERPKRPLPSGAARPATVVAVAAVLFLAGLLLCTAINVWGLGVGAALLLAIAAYNLRTKRLPAVGAANMGVCRGLSLLLGATAVNHGELSLPLMAYGRLDHLAVAAALLTIYIATVTNLARFETRASAPLLAKWLPALALAAGAAIFLPLVGGPNRSPTVALFALGILVSGHAAWQLTRDATLPLPPVIGQLIRLLLPLQAAFCAATGDGPGAIAAALLILLWPVSRVISRQFYAS